MGIAQKTMFYDRSAVCAGGTRWGFDPARLTAAGRRTVEDNIRRWGLDMTIGRHYIEGVQKPYGIRLRAVKPTVTEDVLRPDLPWEGLLNYASMLYDPEDGKYKLWYSTLFPSGFSLLRPDGSPFTQKWGTLYAESGDAVTWVKPPMPYVLHDGCPTNILDVDIDSGAVFTDEHDPASGRFKAGTLRTDFSPAREKSKQVWFTVLASDDGLAWRELGIPPVYHFFDTQNVVAWDRALGKYVGYFRHHAMGRAISRMETDSLAEIPPPQLLLRPDCADPFDMDYYTNGFTVHPYDPDMRLLFSTMYHHGADTLDVRMAVSSDGRSFEWAGRGQVLGNTDADGRFWPGMYAYPSLVPAGDRVGLLFVRSSRGHDDWGYSVYDEPGECMYSMAFWEADRLACLDAEETGEFWTPLSARAGRLEVNYETHGPKGCVRIGIERGNRAAEGFSAEDCIPLSGDGRWRPCAWKDRASLDGLGEGGFSFRIRLENAAIYGIRVVNDASDAAAPPRAETQTAL